MSHILKALNRADQGKGNGETQNPPAGATQLFSFLKAAEEPQARLSDAAVVSQSHLDRRLAALDSSQPIAMESFRLLRHRLERLRESHPVTTVLVTSSIPREGKTMVATNLAAVLALVSQRVLLVDADLRRPTTHRVLGLKADLGLADCLDGRARLEAVYRQIDPLGFYYLSAGKATSQPAESLAKARVQKVLHEAAGAFEWVVVDSPPVNLFADALCLADLCDAVVLVARAGITPRNELQQSLRALADVPLAGVVFNGSDVSGVTYYRKYKSPRPMAGMK